MSQPHCSWTIKLARAVLVCAILSPTAQGQTSAPALSSPPSAADDRRELRPCNILMSDGRGNYATNLWPNGVIPYQFDGNVDSDNQQAAVEAMAEIEAVCSIDFVERASETDYLHIQDSDRNSSAVGKIGGPQAVRIYNWNTEFIICHELMHASALWHEHQRPDRDTYVQINWDYIESGKEHNFEIPPDATNHGPYDFDSVMHYGQFAFNGDTGMPTITVLNPNECWQDRIGQRDHLSVGDGAVLEALYGAGPLRETQKLTAPDGTEEDRFGVSVGVESDAAIIGACWDTPHGPYSGSAYIFSNINGVWTAQAKLTASDGDSRDYFGYPVSISDDVAIVGAPGDEYSRGAVYMFAREGDSWIQVVKLVASDREHGDNFGYAVAVDGNAAVVGAYWDDHDWDSREEGSAYVFERVGGVWSETAKLTAFDPLEGDWFGYSVSISADTIVVGARGREAAYVFTRDGNDWSPQQMLLPSDGEAGGFGISVSIDGDTAVVGAPFDDDNGANSGAAYVFQRTGGTWSQTQRLRAADAAEDDRLGFSVDLDGRTIIAGAIGDDASAGSAYWFKQVEDTWVQERKLRASDGAAGDWFGVSVSVSDGTALVGSQWDDDRGTDSGSAYVLSVSSSPAMIAFREGNDKSWFLDGVFIPGWDHCGLTMDGLAYEAHPGYQGGSYWDPIEFNLVSVAPLYAVQQEHTAGSFLHDSTDCETSVVTESKGVDTDTARGMRTFIETELGKSFLILDCEPTDVPCWRDTLNPDRQKGYDGDEYTCVGLLERAAEEIGLNGGEGFIPDDSEWITIFGFDTFPALSPQLLYWFLPNGAMGPSDSFGPSLQGVALGSVEWIVTDPLGRRLGHLNDTGDINEIPGGSVVGGGGLQQFIIFEPLAGDYTLELFGLGADCASFVGGAGDGTSFEGFLAPGEERTLEFDVPEQCAADFNGDGLVNTQDFIAFLNAWANGDPLADWNADGTIDTQDFIAYLNDWAAGC